MESPFQFVRRYWNPAAVLDALDIKAWPPSVDEADGSFYEGMQVRPAREEPGRTRGDAPSVAPQTLSAAAATANGCSRRPPSPPRPWLSPRDATLRIQSAYRGHRERMGVRRVKELEAEVDAVETRIMASLDQILGDGKETVRVSEMVMDVVVRLDAVKGCCREYRKSVIRKAISLQEALDCLVGGDGKGGGSGGDAADPTNPKALGREANNAGIEGKVEERADDDHDDDPKQGNSSHDDEDEGEEEEEEPSGSSSCCGTVKEALVRVTAENTALRGLVRDLLERSEQQAVVMQQMTEMVDYLERKLQRLGRKRRRSRHGSSEEGPPPPQAEAAASFSSSSSSAGEGDRDRDHDEVYRGVDHGQRTIDRRDGGCQQLQDDRRQR